MELPATDPRECKSPRDTKNTVEQRSMQVRLATNPSSSNTHRIGLERSAREGLHLYFVDHHESTSLVAQFTHCREVLRSCRHHPAFSLFYTARHPTNNGEFRKLSVSTSMLDVTHAEGSQQSSCFVIAGFIEPPHGRRVATLLHCYIARAV